MNAKAGTQDNTLKGASKAVLHGTICMLRSAVLHLAICIIRFVWLLFGFKVFRANLKR